MIRFVPWFFRFLTIAALITVAYMSLRPSLSVGGVPHMDKVLHFGTYGVLAGLARLGWWRSWGGWIFLGLASFGIALEILQHVMDLGRSGSLADTAANCAGAAICLLCFHFFWTRHQS